MAYPQIVRNLSTGGINYLLTNGFQSTKDFVLPINPDITRVIGLPSSNKFYYSNDVKDLPWLASLENDPEQIRRDYASHYSREETYYNQRSSINSDNGDILMTELLEGRSSPAWEEPHYVTSILQAFTRQTELAIFYGKITRVDVIRMIRYPPNPEMRTYFSEATRLAGSDDEAEIQNYLNQVGVVHFKASDIRHLPTGDKLFWLTRFYGAYSTDYTLIATLWEYFYKCTNRLARDFVDKLRNSIVIFSRDIMLRLISLINRSNSYEPLISELQITRPTRFNNSMTEYIRLYTRPANLPPFSLSLLRGLTHDQVIRQLENYTDREIVTVLGDVSTDNRNTFLTTVANRAIQTGIFYLTPHDSELCRNRVTIIDRRPFNQLSFYIGRGSLADGFTCYDIDDLIESFETSRDAEGFYTFRDPEINPVNFTLPQLVEIKEILQLKNDPRSAKFKEYVQIARDQGNVDIETIRQIRRWVQLSQENATNMRQLLISYFHLGMYMRQWKGPGHPYPLRGNETGQEAAVGSELEILIASRVTKERIKFLKIMNRLPGDIQNIIWHLPVYFTNTDGSPERKPFDILHRYNDVFESIDPFCIRLASGPWSYTGAYYMRQIFQENIPGYDIGIPIVGIS